MTRFARLLALAATLTACFEITPPGPCTRNAECGEGSFCSDAGACVNGTAPRPDASGPDAAGGAPVPDARPRPDASTPPTDMRASGPDADADADAEPDLDVSLPDGAHGGALVPDGSHGGGLEPDGAHGGGLVPDAAPDFGSPVPDAHSPPVPDAAVTPAPDVGEDVVPDAAVTPEPDAAPPPDDLLHDLQVDGAPWLRLGEPVRVTVQVDPAVVDSFVEWTATIDGVDAADIDSQGQSSIELTPQRSGEMTIVAAVGGEQIGVTVFVYDCVDRDGDGAVVVEGLPPARLAEATAAGVCGPNAVDCDDGQLLKHPGRAEVCDGLDNDCNRAIDVGAPVDSIQHCGACETSCLRPNVEAMCIAGRCGFIACVTGYRDGNGNLEDGCEVPDPTVCVPTGADDTCDGIDDDCNGVVDDAAGGCANWLTGFCALRQARGVRDTVCEDFDTPLGTRWRRAFPYALTPSPFTQADGRLAPADGRDEGISRSIPLTLAAFRVQFRAAVSNSTLLRVHLTVDDEVEDDGRPVGYMLQLEQNERVSLSTKLPLNPDFVQAEWSVPGLNDGRPRVFEWSREASGRPTLRVDGVLVASSPADPAGGVIAGLSRLAVGFVVPGAAGANDGVDNVVYSADLEGDGVLTPADNCPEITSTDTVDADGDGRGRACDDLDLDGVEDGLDRCRAVPGEDCPDGGGHLIVSLAAGGAERLWRVDPPAGHPRALHAGRLGRLGWCRGRSPVVQFRRADRTRGRRHTAARGRRSDRRDAMGVVGERHRRRPRTGLLPRRGHRLHGRAVHIPPAARPRHGRGRWIRRTRRRGARADCGLPRGG
jgi:hypothetical protein